MHCKFCGEPLDIKDTICPYCNKEQTPEKEETEVANLETEEKELPVDETESKQTEVMEESADAPDTEEVQPEQVDTKTLIDNMPELHDELGKISEMREKAENRKSKKSKVILAIVIVAVCLLGVWLGLFYVQHARKAAEMADSTAQVESSAVPGEQITQLLGADFTDILILDELTAREALDSMLAHLGVTDQRTDFLLRRKQVVGSETYYRFQQMCDRVSVYGGEAILVASNDGKAIALNCRLVETDGLDMEPALGTGSASNAISAYVNKLPAEYRIVQGVAVTRSEKVICNFEGSTYLAYVSNLSGYNEKGEYVAYDAFVDADNGGGIFLAATSSYENENAQAEAPTQAEIPGANARMIPADISAMEMYFVNDKFNWNDEEITGALTQIEKEEILAGNVSGYVTSTKLAVDKAYAYFAQRFGYRGPDGENGAFRVYLNASEYVEDKLPPEMALQNGDVLMFLRQDLTGGELSVNVAAHEYAHSIFYHLAQFDGTRDLTQNTVVAEGLCDVFGELVEAHFNGEADWIHESRNLKAPDSTQVVQIAGPVHLEQIADCYRYSTVVSHAFYQMYANGVGYDALGEIAFRSVCMMTKGADLAQWRTLTEYSAKNMADTGRLSQAQLAVVVNALDGTGIAGKQLYGSPVEALEQEAEPVAEDTETSPLQEREIA